MLCFWPARDKTHYPGRLYYLDCELPIAGPAPRLWLQSRPPPPGGAALAFVLLPSPDPSAEIGWPRRDRLNSAGESVAAGFAGVGFQLDALLKRTNLVSEANRLSGSGGDPGERQGQADKTFLLLPAALGALQFYRYLEALEKLQDQG